MNNFLKQYGGYLLLIICYIVLTVFYALQGRWIFAVAWVLLTIVTLSRLYLDWKKRK